MIHPPQQDDDVDAAASAAPSMVLIMSAAKGTLEMHIKTINLDLAKSVFQAHGVDEERNGAGEEATPQTDDAILLNTASLSDRYGGMCHSASLGAHVECHGSRGAAHTPILREGLR